MAHTSPSKFGDIPSTESTFLRDVSYFVGTWRRTPYDVTAFPKALNGAGTKPRLDGYDADAGSLWRIVPIETNPNALLLHCAEKDGASYLTADLTMSTKKADAAVWLFDKVAPFRGEPNDVAVRLRLSGSDRILCSNESKSTVHLMTEEQAEERDGSNNYIYNIAWELSPDVDEPTTDPWLQKYL